MSTKRSCTRPECDRQEYAHGLCMRDWKRWRANGDPEVVHRPYGRQKGDMDDVVIERAVRGEPPERMTRPERAEAVRILHGCRLTDRQIADRLGVDRKTVWWIRHTLGLPRWPRPNEGLPPRRYRATS